MNKLFWNFYKKLNQLAITKRPLNLLIIYQGYRLEGRGATSPIEDWHSQARSWMLKSKEMKQESGFIAVRPTKDQKRDFT